VSLTVVVDPAHRQRGFARLLAADAAAEEIAAGRQVIAAFGAAELVSRRLVESIGARVAATYYLATPPGVG
jgi:predicted GNAT family acetyltransferase